jgi:amino acid transporter
MIVTAAVLLAVLVSGLFPAVVLSRAGLPDRAVTSRAIAAFVLAAAVLIVGWFSVLYSCDAEIAEVSAQVERRLCSNNLGFIGMATLLLAPAVLLVAGALLARQERRGWASLAYLGACASPALPVLYVVALR